MERICRRGCREPGIGLDVGAWAPQRLWHVRVRGTDKLFYPPETFGHVRPTKKGQHAANA
jgi:hypothetical protein